MASNIALGVVIGGAVGASFGRALSDSSAKISAFKDKAGRLGAEQVRLGAALELRGLNLRRYGELRRETQAIETQWKTSSAKVAELGKRLAEARRTASQADGNGLVNRLAAEAEAMKKQAAATTADWKKKQQQAKAYQDVLATAGSKPDGAQKDRLAAMKAEADTFKKKVADETAAIKRKNDELKSAKQAANDAKVAESALANEFDKAKNAAASSKREFAAKREELHKLKAGLKSTKNEAASATEQMKRLEKAAKGLQLGVQGRAKIGEAWQQTKDNAGLGMAVGAAVAAPTMISANYQATIRDIAIKGGFSNTQQEKDTSERIIGASQATGMNKNVLAEAINTLVGGGMDAEEAVNYSELIGKFSVGQGASPEETAAMINALSQNAQIKTPAQMDKALNAVAYLGKAGSFESKDMAKWFPSLLAEMQKLGITGQDSVTQLGAMLQVSRLTAGTSDEAANNLKNWFSKIGSDETKKNYEKAGIDYAASMETNIAKGWSTLEASLGIAKQYIEKIDPKKAEELKKFAASMDQVSDPAKRQAQIAAFEEVMKTGDLFSDMQVKAALTAYMQNSDHYRKLRDESATATKDLDQGLEERRQTSKQKWEEVGNAVDLAMTRIGDAIRPVTDGFAEGLTTVVNAIAWTAKEFPGLIGGVTALGTAAVAVGAAMLAKKAAGGTLDVLRGGWLARGADKLLPGGGGKGGKLGRAAGEAMDALAGGVGVQRVFVVNMPGGGLSGIDTPGQPGKGAGKGGVGTKIGAAVNGVIGAGKAALAAPTLGAVVSGGAGTVAAGAGMVAAAGAAGYGIGTIINAGIDKAITMATGRENSLGGWLYDKFNPPAGEEKKAPAAPPAAREPRLPAGQNMPAGQNITFAPNISVTVQGDAKDPRQLANELMPHLRRMFEQFQSQSARGAMFDPAHA